MLGRLGPKSSRGADISAGLRRGSGRSLPSLPVTLKDIGGFEGALAAPGRIPRGSFRGALRHLSVSPRSLSAPPRARGARPAAPVLQRAGTRAVSGSVPSALPQPRAPPTPVNDRYPGREAAPRELQPPPRAQPLTRRSQEQQRRSRASPARDGAFAPLRPQATPSSFPKPLRGAERGAAIAPRHPSSGRPGNAARALAPGGTGARERRPALLPGRGRPRAPSCRRRRRRAGLMGSAAPPRRPPDGRRPGPLPRRGGGAGPSLGPVGAGRGRAVPPGPPLGALTAGAGSARGSGLAERGRAGHPAPAAAPSRATARRRGAARDGRTYLCAASPSSPAVLQR